MVANAFNYEGKGDFDLAVIEVRQFINKKLESMQREDFLFEEEFRHREKTPFVLELSLSAHEKWEKGLTTRESIDDIDDTEESKIYSADRRSIISTLTKESRVALLRVYMLHK